MTAQREEWRHQHFTEPAPDELPRCFHDGDEWPCSTVALLAQLDEAEVRAQRAEQAVLHQATRRHAFDADCESCRAAGLIARAALTGGKP